MSGEMHFRCGGACVAASHWVAPMYDAPYIPTLPLDHGWRAAHSTVS
jgi:hypothetical protein